MTHNVHKGKVCFFDFNLDKSNYLGSYIGGLIVINFPYSPHPSNPFWIHMPFHSANNMLIDLPYRSRLFGPRSSFRALVDQSKSPHGITEEIERVGNYSAIP